MQNVAAAPGTLAPPTSDSQASTDAMARTAMFDSGDSLTQASAAAVSASAASLIAELATPNIATVQANLPISPPPSLPPAPGSGSSPGAPPPSVANTLGLEGNTASADGSVNAVQNGQASAASNGGNAAVDGADAFAQSDGAGASVSNGANSAFLSGQGTIAASGTTPGGLVVAVLGSSDAGPAAAPSTRNFNVLVGGVNGLQYSPNQVEALPGDTISFVFGTRNHTLTQSTFADPCKAMDGGANSGFLTSSNDLETTDTSGSPVVQYTVVDTTPRWFFCAQGNHCAKGMVFAVNANANKSFSAFTKAASAGVSTDPSGSAAGSASNGSNPAFVDVSGLYPTGGPGNDTAVSAVLGIDVSGIATNGSIASPVPSVIGDTSATTGMTGCLASDGVLALDNEGGCFLLLPSDTLGPIV